VSERSYEQYCPVAKALDIVGDRWAILILRELALGPKRFTDLAGRLVGIAPNLLTRRLRELQENGIVTRRLLPPPAASQVYELTEAGHAFEPSLMELARWGTRFLGPMEEGEAFYVDWFFPILEEFVDHEAAKGVKETYEFRIEGSVFHVVVDDGKVTITPGPASHPTDLVIETDFATFAAVGFGAITTEEATAQGRSRMEGDPQTLERALDILSPARVFAKVVA
jgi:DNA-binding HxlR family transcriptional regulator